MLNLCIYPHPLLSTPTCAVEVFAADLEKLVDEMFTLMYAANGIGLAAPQIGKNLRLAVINVDKQRQTPLVFINPQIVQKSRAKETDDEGCLSFPEIRANISRHREITVNAQNVSGEKFTLQAEGLLARCLQHEIDHLDNVFFVDRASFATRLSLRSALNELVTKAKR